MYEKPDSKWLPLATVSILGQAPRLKVYICFSNLNTILITKGDGNK